MTHLQEEDASRLFRLINELLNIVQFNEEANRLPDKDCEAMKKRLVAYYQHFRYHWDLIMEKYKDNEDIYEIREFKLMRKNAERKLGINS